MCRGLLGVLLCLFAASAALAGPNAGGTIVVHNPGLAYTVDNTISYCGLGTAPGSCAGADVELDGSSSSAIMVWKVYAAFWPGTSPRLKGITFGVNYPDGPTGIAIINQGPCSADPDHGGSEEPGIGWPGADTGTSVV